MKQILPKIFMLFVLASSFALVSCEKESGHPWIMIFADQKVIAPGETITFTNNNQNVEHFVWEIDSARTFNSKSFSWTFKEPGAYFVKLKAHSEKKLQVREYPVFVGDIYPNAIFINSIDFADPNGNYWDSDGTGPDLEISINRIVSRVNDVEKSDLPLYFLNSKNDPFTTDFPIKEKELHVVLKEFDLLPDSTFRYREIGEWHVNLDTLYKIDFDYRKNAVHPMQPSTHQKKYTITSAFETNYSNPRLFVRYVVDVSKK